jgi:hypothetical protein
MLSVIILAITYKPFTLCVVMLNVVMLSVVAHITAPLSRVKWFADTWR